MLHFDEIEDLFQNNLFIGNRWEYVREKIKSYLLRKLKNKKIFSKIKKIFSK